MKKLYFLILIGLFSFKTHSLFAQDNEYRDKIYLKIESKLVGKIIYYQPKDTVKIELKTGQIISVAPDEIQKIILANETKSQSYEFKEKGIYNASQFSVGFGKTLYSHPLVGISIGHTTGYQFNRLLGVGLGINLDNYYILQQDGYALSVFSEIRGYLNKDIRAFYYSVAGGAGFPLLTKNDKNINLTGHKGGYMLHPAVGLRFGASQKFNFFVDIGAKFQRVSYNQINEWAENHYTVTYRRWILRGGILF